MNPPTVDPRSQALAWAQVFRDDWEECREDPIFAPGKAWSLLAAWGSVCRLFPPQALSEEVSGVGVLIQQDAPALLQALREIPAPAAWIGRARALDRAWDFATQEETLRELEDAAVTLFDELDRYALATCMAQRLAPEGAPAATWEAWQEQVEQAEDCFRDHLEAFLPAAPLAGATLAACRPGLEEDEALWRTVLKHRLLEEAAEELAAAPVPRQPAKAEGRAVRRKDTPPEDRDVLPAALPSPAWRVYPGIAAAPHPGGWTSYEAREPQQRYTARFDLAPPEAQPQVVVTFYRNGHRAEELDKTPVRLRGVPETIDRQGQAKFRRSDLENQSGPVVLEVGDPPVLWPVRTESSHEPPHMAHPGT